MIWSVLDMIELKRIKHKRVFLLAVVSLAILLTGYIGMGIYFSSHFYWGTRINEIDVGGKTILQAKAMIKEKSEGYVLELVGRNEKCEVLKAADFGFEYIIGEQVEALKRQQGAFGWPWEGRSGDYTIAIEIGYDREALKDVVDKLDCLQEENIETIEEPKIEYIYGEYHVIDGKPGNKVDKINLYKEIVATILSQGKYLYLEEASCYEEPFYQVDARKLEELCEKLNHYLKACITYDFEDRQEIVSASLINKWLSFDEYYNIKLDEEAVSDYVLQLAARYDTLHTTRKFRTTEGRVIEVEGGDYGWCIDTQAESAALVEAIKESQILTRQPTYTQIGFSRAQNDIGNTYVEINLTEQYMWFYKEGKLIVEGNVVTGNLRSNHGTPPGTYNLDFKMKHAILRGPGYAAPVSFWMPFNGGIGIHDATWRSSFGGEIYRTDGSHGCINTPYDVAEAVYNNIEAGTPVVCYYDTAV